jgi:hypothetical protein
VPFQYVPALCQQKILFGYVTVTFAVWFVKCFSPSNLPIITFWPQSLIILRHPMDLYLLQAIHMNVLTDTRIYNLIILDAVIHNWLVVVHPFLYTLHSIP